MPNTSFAKKRARQSLKRRARNRAVKSGLRTEEKKLRKMVEEGQRDEAAGELVKLSRALDKGVTKGVVRKNTASRQKSRLSKLVTKMKAESAG